MFKVILKTALKTALPDGLKVKFDQTAGQVLLLTSKDQLIKQLSFTEVEQLVNSRLGDIKP